MSTEVRWRCRDINKDKLFFLKCCFERRRDMAWYRIGSGSESQCRSTEGKIEPDVLGMVSKSVFVEVCLRKSRNIMSQIGTEG